MKKWIFTIVIIGMLGWAMFDFVRSDHQSTEQIESSVDESVVAEEESSADEEASVEVKDNREEAEDVSVGLEIGHMAPDFQLETLDGEEVKLSDFRGSRVMVNFWATWCPPCRAEMPDMEKFYQDKDVVILAVNLTDTENSLDNVEEFRDDFGLSFPILLDKDLQVANLYAIQPIPTSYMVDSNGIITNMAFGALTYDLMVEEFERME